MVPASHSLEVTLARADSSLNDIVKAAVEAVVAATAKDLTRVIAARVADRVAAELAKGTGKAGRGRAAKGRATKPRGEVTKWVADRRARRVPTFVIEMTGLKTKKAIVAKYGADAAFEKGKPGPKAK